MNQTSDSIIYDASADPLAIFRQWLDEATACSAIAEPTAMTLATATASGMPSARIVLLKEVSAQGFTFYSNQQSRKGSELATNPQAALCFYWMPLNKQVRIEGSAMPVDVAIADAYFATRGREKQLGAWASQQSQPMASRSDFEQRIADMAQQFPDHVPRPPHWSGWVLNPSRIEFWLQRDFRLHERTCFTRAHGAWQHHILYP